MRLRVQGFDARHTSWPLHVGLVILIVVVVLAIGLLVHNVCGPIKDVE